MRGLLIAFEGLDQSGKQTQAETLAARLSAGGRTVRQLSFPDYETPIGCAAATELYGSVFKPTIHDEIYSFEDMPRCFQEMHENTQTGIPIIRVADDMPDSVKHLI